jgi:hypothetical protein
LKPRARVKVAVLSDSPSGRPYSGPSLSLPRQQVRILTCRGDLGPVLSTLSPTNIVRRHLHMALKELNYLNPFTRTHKAGNHAFRRFRNTYLRNYTECPEGLCTENGPKIGIGKSSVNDEDKREGLVGASGFQPLTSWISTRRSRSRNERALPNRLMPLSQPIPIHLITWPNHPECAERPLEFSMAQQ